MRRVLRRVEAGGRLVIQNNLRTGRERARQADALLHAAREIGRAHRLGPRQPDRLEALGDARAHLGLGPVVVLVEAIGDVLADRHRVEQRGALEQHRRLAPHLAQLALLELGDVDAADEDAPGVDPVQPDDQLEQHALADARRAEHGHASRRGARRGRARRRCAFCRTTSRRARCGPRSPSQRQHQLGEDEVGGEHRQRRGDDGARGGAADAFGAAAGVHARRSRR